MSREAAAGSDRARVGGLLGALETGLWRTVWTCEKWSEDAVDYVRAGIEAGRLWTPELERIWIAEGSDLNVGIPSSLLRLFEKPDLGVAVVDGNLLLNEGIAELWDLAITTGATKYDNTNADIGVGDSSTAAAATQTDLQAATNKLFKAMVATYPIRTAQTVDFRSDFTSAEANFAWQEWSVRNGNTRNRNLNRKVESLGTKATGTWTLTASLTIA